MIRGSPVRATLANVSVYHQKIEWLDNCPLHFKVLISYDKAMKRYVFIPFFYFNLKNTSKNYRLHEQAI